MAKRALVTGITGFTGSYIAGALTNCGLEVHGTRRPGQQPGAQVASAVLHDVELTRLEDVRKLVSNVRPDVVIHLAGISFAAHENIEELYLSNVVATRYLLQALGEAAGRLPEHVIVASSANVYGNQDVSVLTEDTPVAPANDYGVSKVAAELICRIFGSTLPITIVRPFNYTGVGQDNSFLIPKIVQHFRDRKEFIELGNINVERDFSDVRDVSNTYVQLLGNEPAIGQTLNLCSGKATSLREVIDICTELTRHRIEVRINPCFVRRNEVMSLRGSNDRLRNIVGDTPRIPLSATLSWMLQS